MNEIQFITHFRSAIMRQRIYPEGSPALEEGINELHHQLIEAFETRDTLSLSRTADKFFVDKQPVSQADHLMAIFEDHQLQSLTLHRDVTPPEIRELLVCLGQKAGDRTFGERLLARNVVHVHVNQVRLLEASDEETLVNKGWARFQNMGSFDELKDTLAQTLETIDKIPGEIQREHLRRHMAERLVALEATMIRELFENPLPPSVEQGGVLGLLLEALPESRVMEILNEVLRWDQRIRSLPDSCQRFMDEKASLRAFTAKLLTAPAARRLSRAAYEDLKRRGLIDAVPETSEEQQTRDVVAEAQRLLEDGDERFLDAGGPKGLPGFVERLIALRAPEWIPPLQSRLRNILETSTPTNRFRAAVAARRILPILWLNTREDLAGPLYKSLLQAAEGDRVKPVHKEASEALVQVVSHYHRTKNFIRSLEAAELLRKQFHERNPLVEGQAQAAGEGLRKIVEELRDVLIEDSLSGDEARADPARQLLAVAGDRAVPVYLDIILNSRDARHRQWAAEALAVSEAAARSALAAELTVANTGAKLLNALSVLKDFLGPETLTGLSNLLYFPDVDLRKVVARFLFRIPGEKSSELLARLLLDPEEGVRIIAVEAMGERKWTASVDALLGLLNHRSSGEQEEVCLALGKIGDERAVEPLCQLLRGRAGVFRGGRPTDEAVRVRAAWALARIGTPSAKERLGPFRDDANPMVRDIALKGSTPPSSG